MIKFITINKTSDIYIFDVDKVEIDKLRDRSLYYVIAPISGVYVNFKGETISVNEGDVLFVRDGIISTAYDVIETIKNIESKRKECIADCGDCESPVMTSY